MNITLIVAAALAFAIGITHSVLGERYIVVRLLRRENLPQLFGSDSFTKQTIRYAWHLTTVAWWGLAAILFLVGGIPSHFSVAHGLLGAIAATFYASTLLCFVLTRGRHLSWLVFLAIAVLCTIQLL